MIIGNTVRLTGTFITWAGSKADATEVTLRVYENDVAPIETITLDESCHVAIGTYQYDYVVPKSMYQTPLVFELTGTIEGTPEVARLTQNRTRV